MKPPRIRFPKAARSARIGGFVAPCLAASTATPPAGATFVHEVKFDGYRLQVVFEKRQAIVLTRRGLDWTEKFPFLAKAIAGLPIENAVFDGEAVVEDRHGIADFAALQDALKAGRNQTIAFYIFDLLYVNGHDMKPLPLLQRKQILEQVISTAPPADLSVTARISPAAAKSFCIMSVGSAAKGLSRSTPASPIVPAATAIGSSPNAPTGRNSW